MNMQEKPENSTLKPWAEIYEGLSKPFPAEALKAFPGAGLTLTSIKAQYVVERLNDVVGLGNWRHIGKYEKVEGVEEILFLGELIIYSSEGANQQAGVGSAKLGGRNSLGDSYKGAKTDSLGKCASLYGLGNDVFKGLVNPPGKTYTKKSVKAVGSAEDF